MSTSTIMRRQIVTLAQEMANLNQLERATEAYRGNVDYSESSARYRHLLLLELAGRVDARVLKSCIETAHQLMKKS